MTEEKEETIQYRNMRARRQRIWIYSTDDAYATEIAWRLKKLDLKHEHYFDFEKEGLIFQYIMFSHGEFIYRVPVPVIKALQGEA